MNPARARLSPASPTQGPAAARTRKIIPQHLPNKKRAAVKTGQRFYQAQGAGFAGFGGFRMFSFFS